MLPMLRAKVDSCLRMLDLSVPAFIKERASSIQHLDAGLVYEELHDRSLAMAGGLIARGVTAEDRVATFLPNCIELHQLYFASIAARSIFFPIDPILECADVGRQLKEAQPRLVFTTATLREKLMGSLSFVDSDPLVLILDERMSTGHRLHYLESHGVCLPEYSSVTP